MYKSTKSTTSNSTSNSSRRYSQPVMPNPSPMSSSRRGSEMTGAGRGLELAPPPVPQYDDKPSAVDAKGPRKGRSKDSSDMPSQFDRDKFNPDGSLRTVHRTPAFSDLYNQARGTRYLRHPEPQAYEISLTTKQIFGSEDSSSS